MPEPETVIWLRREHAGTGRPAERSCSELIAAALAIADSELRHVFDTIYGT